MIILCIGLHQSGSTLLYNLVRLMCIKFYGINQVIAGWHQTFESQISQKSFDSEKIYVLKIHEFRSDLDELADYRLMSVRDLRDIVSSNKKRWPERMNQYANFKWRIWNEIENIYLAWKPKIDYLFQYEKYQTQSQLIVQQIAQQLQLKLEEVTDLKSIQHEVETIYTSSQLPEVDNFQNSLYRTTLLSKNHNTSNGQVNHYRDNLSNSEIIYLEKTVKHYGLGSDLLIH